MWCDAAAKRCLLFWQNLGLPPPPSPPPLIHTPDPGSNEKQQPKNFKKALRTTKSGSKYHPKSPLGTIRNQEKAPRFAEARKKINLTPPREAPETFPGAPRRFEGACKKSPEDCAKSHGAPTKAQMEKYKEWKAKKSVVSAKAPPKAAPAPSANPAAAPAANQAETAKGEAGGRGTSGG